MLKKKSSFSLSIPARIKRSDTEPVVKKTKIQDQANKVKEQLDTFVKSFISAFIKRLAIYYLTAKGERLTAEALKAELKLGIISGLIDLSLAQIGLGSLPSIANFIRTLSSQYYLSKDKAQRITKAFELVAPGTLSQVLGVTAVEIFQSFEMQFMHVTDKAGDKMAMEKLAEDAAGRALNYIAEHSENNPISSELITKAIIFGHSEKFFDPSIEKVRIRVSGSSIQDRDGNLINTANLYEKTGLVVSYTDSRLYKLYRANNNLDSARYGYRRLLSWEKDQNNELNALFQTHYRQEALPQQETLFQYNLRRYEYCLQFSYSQQESERILSRYKKLDLDPHEIKISLQTTIKKPPILFNLRKPVKNFTGRTAILNELHAILIAGRATVIVSQHLSTLSIHSSPVIPPNYSINMETAICGLGGIGKTQLALRYAELYAEAYDQNILWINAETKVMLANSLKKLANKLIIETKDRYGEEKDLEEIIDEIYAYFSTGKSLFIFDNVENYRDIESLLPKVQLGNQPKILLTSRYRNWKNIATIISLDVFSEEETIKFIKQELNIQDDTQNGKIKELNNLLQGLPLVLQQTTAYINNQRNVNSQFGISDYISLYQEKSQSLLDFDFSNYSNDPYTKTVLITWQVTLDKIQQDQKAGALAIEILNIMAYICPDNIANSLFLPIKNSERLAEAIHLLKSYSMINQSDQRDTSTVHRLVQQVTRIQLEMNPKLFKKTAQEIIHLIGDYSRNKQTTFHFIYFLLHMNQHLELAEELNFRATQKRILDILTYAETDKDSLIYWFNTAQLLYPRKNYLKFMGEALFVYMHYAMLSLLCDTMDYIENQLTAGILSKTEVLEMLQVKYQVTTQHYKSQRLSPEYEERKRQFDAIRLIYDFEHKLFPPEAATACSSNSRNKRNTDSDCSSFNEEEASIKKPLAYQSIKHHLQKISQITRLISTGLFSKDTLSAIFKGDFSTVAVNFGLLASSKILGKISNKLLTQGEVLSSAAEMLLLKENLDLNSKLALNILTDEAVLNSEKRIFLGNMMKIASPFIERGTSCFFAYTLIQQIKDYQAGNKEELHDIISNGLIVGIDGLESGIEAAEYLQVIEGISSITGPLGESIATIVWLESDLHHVKQHVTAIEQYVHLSRKEELFEDIRAFFHWDPSAYLEIKARNNQRVKKAIAFLKNHMAIQRYVFSAEYSNSQVFLNKKTNIILNKNMPDALTEGSLFCLEGHKNLITKPSQWIYIEPYPPFIDLIFGSELPIYLCKNALGVEYSLNRTGNVTLIALDKGNSTVIAGDSFPTLFLVNQGEKNYSCSDSDCLFILQGEAITGVLSGGKRVNLVNLESFYPEASYTLIDEQGYVCGKNSNDQVIDQFCANGLELKAIQKIRGRIDKKDVIYIAKAIEDVDAYGGKNLDHPDHIYITNKSSRNLKIVLRANTVVHYLESNITVDTVDYRIPHDQAGESSVQLLFNSSIQHRFYFDFGIEDLTSIIFNDNKLMFNFFYQQRTYSLTITDSFKGSKHDASYPAFPSQAYYLFQDNTEIKLLSNTSLYARQHTHKTLTEIVNYYPSIASRLNMMLSIQLSQNETVLIGHGKHVILCNDGFAKSHLIGNGVENVYLVSSAINDTDPFPIPEVILYNLGEKYLEATDTLDLRYIEQQAKKQCSEQKITPSIAEEGMDLVLSLNAQYYRLSASHCTHLSIATWPIASVRIKNALVDNWYQQLDILLQSVPMNIIANHQGWRLEQLPLVYNHHKDIIVITATDIESEPEIMIVKKAGEYGFFRNESDLFITNIVDSNTLPNNFWTVMLHLAYQPSKIKLLSATLTFIDQEIVLKEHKKQIKNAPSFQDLLREYTDEASNAALNKPHDSFTQDSEQQHLPTNKKLARRKRQVDHSALMASSEDRHIDAIAEQYLEKYDYHNLKAKAYRSKKENKIKPLTLNSELKTKQAGLIKQNTSALHPINPIQAIKKQKFQAYPNFKKIKKGSKSVLPLPKSTKINKGSKPVLPRSKSTASNTIEKVFYSQKRFITPHHQAQRLANSFHSVNYLPDNKQADRRIPISTTSFMKPRLSYQHDTHSRQASYSRTTATSDVQGLIFLVDVFTRKITKEKYKQPFFAKTKTKLLAEQVERIQARASWLPRW